MKTLVLMVGIFAILIGLVWIGQGTGYFPYPQTSFMISQIRWAYYGAGLGMAGLVIILLARRA
ncbi:MAG: hypothetical protein HY242_09265 [Afipia sp.]|nr:hypothetical protein [Afipia sp.]